MKKKYVIFLVLVSVLFTACNQNQVNLNNKISDSHIIVENESLYNWLNLDAVNYFIRDDSLLEVEARFRNFTSSNKLLAYKIDWMDKNGFVQKSILSKWVIVKVEERRNLVIHGIAPSMKVKDFSIRLQEPTKDDNLRKDSYHREYQGN